MFSVIIPLYNKQISLQNTLQNALKQTYRDFEVIVIDDGSTDSSAEIVNEYMLMDKRIRLFQQENSGVCSARNMGIKMSKYDYIAFLDADDIWNYNYLEEQNKLIRDFPEAAMWGTNFALVNNGVVKKLDTGFQEDFRGYVTDYFSMARVSDLFCSSSVVVRKDAFDIAGMFDTRIKYSEDIDMWYRIILNFPVVFNAQIFVYYSQDAENRALKKNRSIKDFLPFYVSKYNQYCEKNHIFSHYIHTFSASHLIYYYFGKYEERDDANVAVKYLRYDDIHPKYRLLYNTPYLIGIFFYCLMRLKQKIWQQLGIKIRLYPKPYN